MFSSTLFLFDLIYFSSDLLISVMTLTYFVLHSYIETADENIISRGFTLTLWGSLQLPNCLIIMLIQTKYISGTHEINVIWLH